ncbi:hypothetical protein IVA98_05660 [Bradyrhizobium sp. 160]|uniref:hypothetical protein n=1 Tax=unclassified Bradyrhizobium TaxID=2631580 RepID=UPI001FF96B90|nr:MULTISPECIES: hypothetical protein [unclassified Bradyrhizobium]MCK1544013.1 hypothetical protein [Bradyrhizobium sp. 179]MCK1622740.1 hypothetical protein [Bradyrhizobium sp. 160]
MASPFGVEHQPIDPTLPSAFAKKRTALEDMDAPEILKLLKEIEDEIRRRGF